MFNLEEEKKNKVFSLLFSFLFDTLDEQRKQKINRTTEHSHISLGFLLFIVFFLIFNSTTASQLDKPRNEIIYFILFVVVVIVIFFFLFIKNKQF